MRIGNGRVLRLGSFFLTKLWSDADLVSIGELQLLWMDSRGPNQPLASLRLYFLPENTPDGRRDTHGEVSDFAVLSAVLFPRAPTHRAEIKVNSRALRKLCKYIYYVHTVFVHLFDGAARCLWCEIESYVWSNESDRLLHCSYCENNIGEAVVFYGNGLSVNSCAMENRK